MEAEKEEKPKIIVNYKPRYLKVNTGIFDYSNYRHFLKDYFKILKEEGLSFRKFAKQNDITAPTILSDVLAERRILSETLIQKFSQGMGLSKMKAHYFFNLVKFNQAKSLDQKEAYWKKILDIRRLKFPKKVDVSQYKFYSKWYVPLIYEIATRDDFKGDLNRLRTWIKPRIKEPAARSALNLLVRYGFLRKARGGKFQKTERKLKTDSEVFSFTVRKYHKQVINLAAEALEKVPQEDRGVRSSVIHMRSTDLAKIKGWMEDLHDKIIAEVDGKDDPDMVFQVNHQIFPITTKM